jgi:hypothetical protein
MKCKIRNYHQGAVKTLDKLQYIFLLFTIVFIGCKDEIKDLQPKSTFELSKDSLPPLSFALDSNNLNAKIRFEDIAQGGEFSVSFTPFTYGRIEIIEGGRAVQIAMQQSNWQKDSSIYTICKSGVCRSGVIKLINSSFIKPLDPEPVDSTSFPCFKIPVRTFYIPFDASLKIENIFPQGIKSGIETFSVLHYTLSANADTTFQYFSGGVAHEQAWAWDTIYYTGKSEWNRCYEGKIALVLGDTCEPSARNDLINVPAGGSIIFSEQVLVANDRGCNNQLGNFITRTDTEFDYGNYKVMELSNGILALVQGGGCISSNCKVHYSHHCLHRCNTSSLQIRSAL